MQKKRGFIGYYALLFSIVGLLVYVLLSNSTNLAEDSELLYEYIWGYLFFIGAFNVMGFLTIKLSQWIGRYVMQRWRMALIYSCVAAMLLTVNYSLLVLAKVLVGVKEPYVFPHGGARVLIIMWLLSLIILGLLVVNQAVLKNMHIQQQAFQLQEENNKAKYAALQRQLNPHFLFNNLNTLIAEIEYDPQNAARFTRNLSDAYRYVLQCQDKRLISLRKELEFMQAYLFLHCVRIGDYITVKCRLEESHYEAMIPPLTLQLLIENVIKHNVISEHNPMQIEIGVEESYLVVSNGIAQKRGVEPSGKGLTNLAKRALLIAQKEIIIEKTAQRFTVKVPLLYE